MIEPIRTAKHAAQWIASLENHIAPAMWNKPIADITDPRELLAALIDLQHDARATNKSGGLRETRRRLQQRLAVVFDDAIFHGRCAENPAKPVRQKLAEVTPRRVINHLRALPYSEAPAFAATIRATAGTAAASLEFALLTAARTNEVLLAEWPEFDLPAKVWVLPASRSKSGREHRVHLSQRALEIIAAQAGQHSRLVFPSPAKPDSPQSNMAMLNLLDRLGMRDRTTVHGLCRATFSTWANETGAARPEVIEAALAHVITNRDRKAYNRASYFAERAQLLDSWAGFLAGG